MNPSELVSFLNKINDPSAIGTNIAVKATVEVPFRMLQGMIITVLDQGYDWFKIGALIVPKGRTKDEYRISKEFGNIAPRYNLPFVEGGGVEIFELNPDEDDYTVRHELTFDKLKNGIQIMAEKYPIIFSEVMSENDDINTADAFLQCALLGELIYG